MTAIVLSRCVPQAKWTLLEAKARLWAWDQWRVVVVEATVVEVCVVFPALAAAAAAVDIAH